MKGSQGVSTEVPAVEEVKPTAPDSTNTGSTSQDIETVKADYEARLAQIKKSQAGSDKLVTDLKKELEDVRKSQMGDKERMEYERKLFEQEKLELERQRRAVEIEKLRSDYIADNKVDPRFRPLLSESTEEGLKAQSDLIKSLIDETEKRVRAEYDKIITDKARPGGGTTAATANPFIPGDGFSLSEQTRLYRENKQEFERLRIEAEMLRKKR
jgi:hypothetical protein